MPRRQGEQEMTYTVLAAMTDELGTGLYDSIEPVSDVGDLKLQQGLPTPKFRFQPMTRPETKSFQPDNGPAAPSMASKATTSGSAPVHVSEPISKSTLKPDPPHIYNTRPSRPEKRFRVTKAPAESVERESRPKVQQVQRSFPPVSTRRSNSDTEAKSDTEAESTPPRKTSKRKFTKVRGSEKVVDDFLASAGTNVHILSRRDAPSRAHFLKVRAHAHRAVSVSRAVTMALKGGKRSPDRASVSPPRISASPPRKPKPLEEKLDLDRKGPIGFVSADGVVHPASTRGKRGTFYGADAAIELALARLGKARPPQRESPRRGRHEKHSVQMVRSVRLDESYEHYECQSAAADPDQVPMWYTCIRVPVSRARA
jgi:hypothetical protein